MNRFPLCSAFQVEISRLYDIQDARANSRDYISSSLPLTHCMRTCPLLACHPHKFSWSYLNPVTYTEHVTMLPSSMPPTQFTQHFHREHLRTLYFRYPVHLLLFLFPVSDFCSCIDRCQKESSSQYPTI